ncbi:flocculation protein FLO11 isoform X2 [Hyalella azteca]|uniref:Flocculation protein FLO11 isoform X2 n=1 Tax=Hyalella azteca TaxID=294128 RepID=A0A8B7NCD9_HYAAZ|nr:flocculation protein FLO11 isoform X2 [Hyalella azteca]
MMAYVQSITNSSNQESLSSNSNMIGADLQLSLPPISKLAAVITETHQAVTIQQQYCDSIHEVIAQKKRHKIQQENKILELQAEVTKLQDSCALLKTTKDGLDAAVLNGRQAADDAVSEVAEEEKQLENLMKKLSNSRSFQFHKAKLVKDRFPPRCHMAAEKLQQLKAQKTQLLQHQAQFLNLNASKESTRWKKLRNSIVILAECMVEHRRLTLANNNSSTRFCDSSDSSAPPPLPPAMKYKSYNPRSTMKLKVSFNLVGDDDSFVSDVGQLLSEDQDSSLLSSQSGSAPAQHDPFSRPAPQNPAIASSRTLTIQETNYRRASFTSESSHSPAKTPTSSDSTYTSSEPVMQTKVHVDTPRPPSSCSLQRWSLPKLQFQFGNTGTKRPSLSLSRADSPLAASKISCPPAQRTASVSPQNTAILHANQYAKTGCASPALKTSTPVSTSSVPKLVSTLSVTKQISTTTARTFLYKSTLLTPMCTSTPSGPRSYSTVPKTLVSSAVPVSVISSTVSTSLSDSTIQTTNTLANSSAMETTCLEEESLHTRMEIETPEASNNIDIPSSSCTSIATEISIAKPSHAKTSTASHCDDSGEVLIPKSVSQVNNSFSMTPSLASIPLVAPHPEQRPDARWCSNEEVAPANHHQPEPVETATSCQENVTMMKRMLSTEEDRPAKLSSGSEASASEQSNSTQLRYSRAPIFSDGPAEASTSETLPTPMDTSERCVSPDLNIPFSNKDNGIAENVSTPNGNTIAPRASTSFATNKNAFTTKDDCRNIVQKSVSSFASVLVSRSSTPVSSMQQPSVSINSLIASPASSTNSESHKKSVRDSVLHYPSAQSPALLNSTAPLDSRCHSAFSSPVLFMAPSSPIPRASTSPLIKMPSVDFLPPRFVGSSMYRPNSAMPHSNLPINRQRNFASLTDRTSEFRTNSPHEHISRGSPLPSQDSGNAKAPDDAVTNEAAAVPAIADAINFSSTAPPQTAPTAKVMPAKNDIFSPLFKMTNNSLESISAESPGTSNSLFQQLQGDLQNNMTALNLFGSIQMQDETSSRPSADEGAGTSYGLSIFGDANTTADSSAPEPHGFFNLFGNSSSTPSDGNFLSVFSQTFSETETPTTATSSTFSIF